MDELHGRAKVPCVRSVADVHCQEPSDGSVNPFHGVAWVFGLESLHNLVLEIDLPATHALSSLVFPYVIP